MLKSLLAIIAVERKTLLRGFLIVFIVVFPLTFLPLSKTGFTRENILNRIPLSAAYTFGFAAILIIAAVGHNYNSLVYRIWYFNLPAFKKLRFQERFDGVNSVVRELEIFLLGKLGDYFFRLNIGNPNRESIKIEIIPLIDLEGDNDLEKKLKKELGFRQDELFGKTILAKAEALENENFLLEVLSDIDAKLSQSNIIPLDLSDINDTQ